MLTLFNGIIELFEGSLSSAAKKRLVAAFESRRYYCNSHFWQYGERLQNGEVFEPATVIEDLDLRCDRVARLDAWLSAANLASFKVSSEVPYLFCAKCLCQTLANRW